ncbi:MAG: hypothetical protein HQL03_11015 [Nitrospirae bacterium]|nr:hypothetical protein [Nitrospirota bacterium]MBF0591195.1 hypothetical protein [Nitrospirota bacterium]
MLRTTQEVSKAVVTLKDNPDWRSVMRWLETQLVEHSLQNNSQRDEVLLRMGQGRALMLKELIRVFNWSADERSLPRQTETHEAGAPFELGVADPSRREKPGASWSEKEGGF